MLLLFLRKAAKSALVISNLVVAMALFTGAYGGWLNPASFWITGYFTLALFYILLINAGFFVFWLLTRPWFSLISLISIIACWVPLTQVIPPRLSASFEMKKQAGDLRVLSWNVEHFDILEHKTHPENKVHMINVVNEFIPDVACFQEMVASDSFPSAINYLPDFREKLNMPFVHFSFNPKLDFDRKHHFGLVIFSRYPIVNSRTVSYRPHDYNSIFQYADIARGADTFRVFNIHLQSLRFSGDNLRYIEDPSMKDEIDLERSKSVFNKFRKGFLKRKQQSDRIREEIEQSPYPVIVCGDFNDVPNSYAYNRIGRGLRNAFAEKGVGTGRTFYGISPTLRIDNIFSDKRFSVDQYIRLRRKLSDHYPIVADLHYRLPE